MPKYCPENDCRMEIRLPEAMLYALKWTAKYDRLPLSDWVRNTLNEHCYSVHFYPNPIGQSSEVLMQEPRRRPSKFVDSRPLEEGSLRWVGARKCRKDETENYVDMDRNQAQDAWEKVVQDHLMGREQARRELRTFKNKWGRVLKTSVLRSEQARLLDKLLATFDREP